jgi:hypothetical protein
MLFRLVIVLNKQARIIGLTKVIPEFLPLDIELTKQGLFRTQRCEWCVDVLGHLSLDVLGFRMMGRCQANSNVYYFLMTVISITIYV